MANATLSKDEILEAIGNMTVFELVELNEAFKTKFNVTIAIAAAGGPAAAAAAGRPSSRQLQPDIASLLSSPRS
jgi:large subunit ribosomal protein L7/L12